MNCTHIHLHSKEERDLDREIINTGIMAKVEIVCETRIAVTVRDLDLRNSEGSSLQLGIQTQVHGLMLPEGITSRDSTRQVMKGCLKLIDVKIRHPILTLNGLLHSECVFIESTVRARLVAASQL